MTIYDKIFHFIESMRYMENEHVLGILFYGSYLTGFYSQNSDIDLHIIFDNEDLNHLIRGNKIVDGTRIEYFEKPINDIYLTVDDDYQNQNNASLSIFGKSKIIYERDNQMKNLQQYVLHKFSNQLPPLSEEAAKEQVSIINNRMEKLQKYAYTDNPYFEHLYHLTIDKIRRFYHNLNGLPRIETSKGFRLYTDEKYRNSFCIHQIPEEEFIKMHFEAISNNKASKIEKYQLLNRIYEYTKRNVSLPDGEYRIRIKSRNEGFDIPIRKPSSFTKRNSIDIPKNVLNKILKFIKEMDYLNMEHCLGIIVYGSSQTGFNTEISDIDLHIIFDDTEPEVLIRGSKIVDGTKIEYFEKPIRDIYLSVENGYLNQDNAFLSIIGYGTIVFERKNELSKLQQYIINRYTEPMPPLSEEEAREQVSIINNRMEKLEKLARENDEKFDHLYHLAIDKIRKFYHKLLGISKIPTSKVYRIYTEEGYRKSMYKSNPDNEFVAMYLSLITTTCENRMEKFYMIKRFYEYATRGINLGNTYRISIKSRNKIGKSLPAEDTVDLPNKPLTKKKRLTP